MTASGFQPPDMQECKQKCRCGANSANAGQVFNCENPCVEAAEWDTEACECLLTSGTCFVISWVTETSDLPTGCSDAGNTACTDPSETSNPYFDSREVNFSSSATYLGVDVFSQGSSSASSRSCSTCEAFAPNDIGQVLGLDEMCDYSNSTDGPVNCTTDTANYSWSTQGVRGQIVGKFLHEGVVKGVSLGGLGGFGGISCCYPDVFSDFQVTTTCP